MSFSCTIKLKNGHEITSCGDENDTIHFKLYGLSGDKSPYDIYKLRKVISCPIYDGELLPWEGGWAASYFKNLQEMVHENMDALKLDHCNTCSCSYEELSKNSKGIIPDRCIYLLSINHEDVDYIMAGY